MRKIFPFDPVDARRRAEVARREAAKAAIDTQFAEQRRRAGEKAAAELKSFDLWFADEAAREAAAERARRVAAAALRPIIARAAPEPDRVISLSLFEEPIDEAIFAVRTTAREIEKLSHGFGRHLRKLGRVAPDLTDIPIFRPVSDIKTAISYVEDHSHYGRYFVRSAMAWLIWNIPDYRASLSDRSVAGVAFIVEGTTLRFGTRREGSAETNQTEN